jgi:excisionase family DNA binding protein
MDTYNNIKTHAGQEKLLLTVEEAALQLSLSRSTVYELLANGEIRSLKIGRCRRIPQNALAEFVSKLG